MFGRKDQIVSEPSNLSNYIDGFDVFDSRFIYELNKPGIPKELYKITVYDGRPDLIAKDFYGSDSYLGIVILQGGSDLSNYKIGNLISLVPRSKIDTIINLLQC